MKRKYKTPGFYPITLDANVVAETCTYTNNYSWGACAIELDGLGAIFVDTAKGCNIMPENLGIDPSSNTCYDIAGANSNTFGS